MKTTLLSHLACGALIAPAFAQAPAAASFEQGALVQAAVLLPADLLRGPSYRVRDLVGTDGYMAHFEIDTDFGTFNAIGVPQAKQRIVEIEAIRKLVDTSKGDLFAEGVKRSIEQPIDAVKNIVTNPVKSVKQAPKTVGHFFSKLGGSIERGARKMNESANSNEDPDVAAREMGAGIGTAAKNAAGFDKAKLDTAKQLGVDPYSDNTRLQEEMEKVTWAFFAGGLPLRIGAAVASAGVAVAATNMVGIPEDTYALTQSELALRDAQTLKSIGTSEADLKAFQIHRALSTTRRHRIATLLATLPNAMGRASIVGLANACETSEQADFLIGALAILAEQQRSGAANYTSVSVLGRLPAATTASGEVQVPAPVDHVTWTEDVAGFAKREDLVAPSRTLVHTGTLSPAAAAGIAAAGWKTVAVPYPSR
jgi:hypothetical protein